MAHLKDLVVNGNSRTLGTSYATNYSGKWEGISNDINTENTSDTWVPVLTTNGVLQHRSIPAAYNNDPSTLSVNYAKTSGTANNVAWGGVTGKPATYTPSAHTHNIITSYGDHNETASDTTPNDPTTGMAYTGQGLYMTQTYSDTAAPTYYGNVINVVGRGTGQLLLGWSGFDNAQERLYYRSHRDTSGGGWSKWGTVAYLDDIDNMFTVKSGKISSNNTSCSTATISYICMNKIVFIVVSGQYTLTANQPVQLYTLPYNYLYPVFGFNTIVAANTHINIYFESFGDQYLRVIANASVSNFQVYSVFSYISQFAS